MGLQVVIRNDGGLADELRRWRLRGAASNGFAAAAGGEDLGFTWRPRGLGNFKGGYRDI